MQYYLLKSVIKCLAYQLISYFDNNHLFIVYNFEFYQIKNFIIFCFGCPFGLHFDFYTREETFFDGQFSQFCNMDFYNLS